MKKIFFIVICLLTINIANAAPTARYDRTIIPETDSTYDLGTSLKAWLTGYFDTICLSGDCKSAWPTGGGGSGDSVWSRNSTTGLIYHPTTTDTVVSGVTATSSTPTFIINNSSRRVGIGTSTPYAPLSVVGQIVASFFTATTTTATSTFLGGFEAGTSGLSVLQNGRVGIGNTSPRSPLDVTGSIIQSWSDNFLGTQFQTGSYQMGLNTDSTNRILYIDNKDSDGIATRPSIQLRTGTVPNTAMTVMANSNVGIGTTSPYTKLAVTGEVVGNNFTATSTGATSTFSGGFISGGASGFRVLSNGMVGIATTTPTRPLEVNGQIVGTYYTADSSIVASRFPLANITKLSNLTSNGFVKTSGSDGTLSIDTTTYQASGNYITALTGDVTASGPGSAAATLATVNSNVGSFTNANITVNAKGLITAASNGTAGGGTGTVGTSSVPVKGNLAYWTTDTATPALLGTIATTSVSCSGSTTCTSFTVIGSSPITISSTGGGGSGGGTWSTTTSTVSGQLVNYPNNTTDIVAIGSNSTTTSEYYFDPNTKTAVLGLDTGFLGGKVYTNGLFGTKSQVMMTGPVNDLQSNLVIGNTYSASDGLYATGGITFVNGRSTQGATFQTSDYYTYLGLAGPNFAAFSGLPPNGFVLSNTDGPVILGATSANVASSTIALAIGSGYAVGNYDMILKNVDTAGSTNTASGGLGIGTTTPSARLSLAASSTATFDYMNVYQHVNGVTTGIPVFNVNKNENVGVASTTPWARLSVNPNGISGPSFVVGSSTGTSFIVDSGGDVGINTTNPTFKLTVGQPTSALQTLLSAATGAAVVSYSGNSTMFGGEYTGSSGSGGGSMVVLTQNDGAAAASGDRLGGFQFGSYDGTSQTRLGGAIIAYADGAWSNTSIPTNIRFETAASGATTRTERLRVDSQGRIGIATTTPISTLSVQGSLCVRNTGSCGTTAGTIYATTATITDIDLAENYPTTDITLKAGEIVALDPNNNAHVKRAKKGDTVIGIVSTKPGLLLGKEIPNSKPIALSGRVPLKVNNEGGAIKIGDRISLSSVAGIGKKAESGETVGIALENMNGKSGTIEVFVNLKEDTSELKKRLDDQEKRIQQLELLLNK